MVVVIVASLIALVGAPAAVVVADGEDLIAVKGSVQGVIDGAAGADGYSGPITLSNGLGSFQVQTYRHPLDGSVEEEIQLLFTISDSSTDVGDEIRISFDLDHDNTASSPDRGIVVKRSPASVKRTNVNLFGPPTELGDLAAAQWQVDSNPGDWIAEVKIKASDISLNFIPSLVGILVEVKDVDAGVTTTGLYPASAIKVNMETWANLKTRNPLEYVILLDRSGSMGEDFDGNWPAPEVDMKWTAAKKATDIFAQIFFAFRPTEDATATPYFDDKMGLATYTWSPLTTCYSTPGAGMDDSQAVKSLTQLKNIVQDGYTDSPPSPGSPVGCTPIKRGLDAAFSMFSAGSGFEKVILLMSDGIHNRPSMDYAHEAYHFPAATGVSDYQVNTVALGLDENVDTALLQSINLDFSGFAGSYTNAAEEKQLVNTFVENLFGHLYLNQVPVNASGEFQVNHNEPRLLVMLVWNSQTGVDRGFRIKKPNDSIIGTADPGYHHYRDTALDYEIAYYLLSFPTPAGTWQTIQLGSTNPEVADNNYALFDPTVYAFFSVVQDGDDFILKAVLKENGVPITEPEATVVVDVTKPDEGLGTYASTAQPNCTFAPPVIEGAIEFNPMGWAWRELLRTLSSLLSFRGRLTTLERPPSSSALMEAKVSFQAQALAPLAATAVQTTTVELLPPRFAKVRELFIICDKDGLNRSGLSVQLHDDGTHGDETANDGIFTLRFDDTQHEGTYTFDFTASGTAPTAGSFSRIRTLSAHKSVNVAPENSEFKYVELLKKGDFAFVQYYVLPKSFDGEYLGPGHLPQVEFSTTGGEWQTEVIDHNNGLYSRVLRHDTTQGEPFVTPVIQGEPVQVPWQVFLRFILLLIILFILLIILRLLLYVRRLKRKIPNP